MAVVSKYEKRVRKVLGEQGFIIGPKEDELIRKRATNGRRYFFIVAPRREGSRVVERFIKIPENNTQKLQRPFRRQIEVARYLKTHRVMNTRGVITTNIDPKRGSPFVVLETLPTRNVKIGFIEGNKGAERLGTSEARSTLEQLYKFHSIRVNSLPLSLRKILKIYPGDYKSFRREISRLLSKKVRPLDGGKRAEPFYLVLERRTGVSSVRIKIKELLDRLEPIVDSKENRRLALVHGDMAPNNLYVFDSGKVELLDLEWVGVFKNSAIAMILDFGNLRARSWSNKKFRDSLDDALISAYKANHQEELGKAIVQLSILRSHLLLSGFFENYPLKKQKDSLQSRRRKSTESDLLALLKS